MSARDLINAASNGSATTKLYVDDVFSTTLYDGTGADQIIHNGIALADGLSLKPGDPVGGGYYAGVMRYADGDYILITAPKAAETSLTQKTTNTATAGTSSYHDGLANSNAMNNATHPAAQYCRGYAGGGFNDWYLPARDELEVLYRYLKPSTSTNYTGARNESGSHGQNANSVPAVSGYTASGPTQTAATQFRTGGAEVFTVPTFYWTSTEYAPNTGNVWMQRLTDGYQYTNTKTGALLVRPVRRIKLTDSSLDPYRVKGEGGLVWIKQRSGTGDNLFVDTTRGNTKALYSNGTSGDATTSAFLSKFLGNGFALGTGGAVTGVAGSPHASWTFRNAPKFFTHLTISHTTGTATNIDLSSLGEVGMMVAKATSTTGDWITWHRSLTAGNNLLLNLASAQSTTNAWLSVSGTTGVLSGSAPTATYVIYAWAHDASSEGMVQCGTYTTTSSPQDIILGWEPQFLLIRRRNALNNWNIVDTTRGLTISSSHQLAANVSSAETNPASTYILTATGFTEPSTAAGNEMVYLAIRMPNKPPLSAQEVFQPVVYTGTNTDNRLVETGIQTDMVMARVRSLTSTPGFVVGDRLRGNAYLGTATNAAESNTSDGFDSQIVSTTEYGTSFSSNKGFYVGNNAAANINSNTTANNHIAYAFKRAPGFFDMVAYTGNGVAGRTLAHQLGVAPELMIVRTRSASDNWYVWCNELPATNKLLLNDSSAQVTDTTIWNSTAPTTENIILGASPYSNGGSVRYIAYLFASLPGISKVGSYVGNGASQTIDCGFAGGARFVMIKKVTDAGNWCVLDTSRGINTGNDPLVALDGSWAEATALNMVYPSETGFGVVQETSYNINDSSTYIYLAIA